MSATRLSKVRPVRLSDDGLISSGQINEGLGCRFFVNWAPLPSFSTAWIDCYEFNNGSGVRMVGDSCAACSLQRLPFIIFIIDVTGPGGLGPMGCLYG
jgi:hypothetical protein